MRTALTRRSLPVRVGVAAVATAATLGLAACGADTAGSEAGADVEDVTEDGAADDTAADTTADTTDAAEDTDAVDAEEPLDDEPLAEEPYVGPYDTAFADDVDSYVGQVVALSADVNEVLTPEAFTIAGTDDTTVAELLVVGATEQEQLTPETTVQVTGTVQESFVLPEVEEELGVDLDDATFAEWEQEPFVIADSVEVLEDVQG